MLNKQHLKYLIELAKINIDDKELDKLLIDLNNILNFIDEIKKLNLNNFQPLVGGVIQKLELREDEIHQMDESTKEKIIEQFPQKENNYLKVPKIILK
ncbi:MAG: hypothetical protein KatS3mg094_143 [Candidatus Parcubacteria bacterium]|nr:MAG: hypothetical protein KatS3mg094_143 [Candidatus Parcubacteria bacterium]